MCSNIGMEPKHCTTADWKDRLTKGVDHASGMFDTDVKGGKKLREKKEKKENSRRIRGRARGSRHMRTEAQHKTQCQHGGSTGKIARDVRAMWIRFAIKNYSPLRKRRECVLNTVLKTTIGCTGVIKIRPAKTSQKSQLELALRKCSNLQICSWDANRKNG